jgi:hypothetical protein
MSINALTNTASTLLAPRPDTTANGGIGTPSRANGANGANTLATALTNGGAKDAYTASSAATSSLTARAPEGTDPGLWSVLTSEERNFFSKTVTSGPLTYSRVMLSGARATPAPAARGGRIDIRA